MKATFFKIEDPWGPVFTLRFNFDEDKFLQKFEKSQWCDISDFANEYYHYTRDNAKIIKAKLKKGDDNTVLIKVYCFLKTKMPFNVDEGLDFPFV